MIPRFWRPGRWHWLPRLALAVPAGVFRITAAVRALWHRSRRHQPLAQPGLVIGNLSVGGTGKTPLTLWWAREALATGAHVGVIMHPAAYDEALLFEAAVPECQVHVDRHRRRAARAAVAAGAQVLLFDDGLQHPGLEGMKRITVVAIEQETLSTWPVPAGPWREGRRALWRSELIVVTRKSASAGEAAALARRLAEETGRPTAVAALVLTGFRTLRGGRPVALEAIAGRAVVAVAGVADPEPFRAQLQAIGAHVTLRAFPDHHRYGRRDIRSLVEESGRTDYVITTSKDAVKLRTCWPVLPEPLVAELAVHWEAGSKAALAVLHQVLPERSARKQNHRQVAAGIS